MFCSDVWCVESNDELSQRSKSPLVIRSSPQRGRQLTNQTLHFLAHLRKLKSFRKNHIRVYFSWKVLFSIFFIARNSTVVQWSISVHLETVTKATRNVFLFTFLYDWLQFFSLLGATIGISLLPSHAYWFIVENAIFSTIEIVSSRT